MEEVYTLSDAGVTVTFARTLEQALDEAAAVGGARRARVQPAHELRRQAQLPLQPLVVHGIGGRRHAAAAAAAAAGEQRDQVLQQRLCFCDLALLELREATMFSDYRSSAR